ncbi:GrpB family protein [Jeotgalibacillus sp. ET6]|uniref:GrpB family protein n=1 Tax=Jeotgalibacillus sp. ET6 TaxID=3037260 RepID=UPI0024186E6F|nr:GrpB family protein [Jeotgalibacillus sp. ET6]MDG5472018.1 GrpB family protein [Jeotgalibacillus sp. ET6]
MKQNGIVIEEYNPEWKLVFRELKNVLEHHLGDLILRVEHVGSTSVEGLSAKPIIDLDVVISRRELLPEVVDKLSEIGYSHEGDQGIKGREAFKRANSAVPYSDKNTEWMAHHLYVCAEDNEELKRHLAFRDYLRVNPDACLTYEQLKRELARTSPNRDVYTDGKDEFVLAVLKKAAVL